MIYPTAVFFTNPQILAVGAVRPDGSFTVQLPARVPVDLLAKSTSQCATLRSSDPDALSTFIGDSLVYQHGTHIGKRSLRLHPGHRLIHRLRRRRHPQRIRLRQPHHHTDRVLPADHQLRRDHREFRQNFDLPLHRGWNPVVADFSVPQTGHIVANLKPGTGPLEKWYFFRPTAP